MAEKPPPWAIREKRGNKMEWMEYLHTALEVAVELGIMLFEWVGVAVLVVSGVLGVVHYIRRDPETRLKLAQGLAMALEFKLGGEILRTVVVRDLKEIALVGAIILLRAALTFLIHWEIKNEEASLPEAGHGPRSHGERK